MLDDKTAVKPEVALTPAEIDDLKKKAAERDQYLDLAQRTRAEFDNYQKRNRQERDQERKYAYTPLVRDLLPVIDNLQRALDAARKSGDAGPLAQGVAMVESQFLELLKRNGIVSIEAEGKPFDPNLHQAVMQKPSDELEPNSVIQVLEHGFMNHDRVLRPSKVVVSTKS
jgi:molecular chaperone GrpE